MKLFSKFFLFFCFFIGFFSNFGNLAQVFQILSVSFLIIAAIFALVSNAIKKINISYIELLFFIIGIVSLMVGLTKTDNIYLASFSVIYLFAISSIIILVRYLSLDEVLRCLAFSYIFIIIYILLTDFNNFIFSLGVGEVYGKGFIRFQPLDLHPNLTGFIFSAGIILFLIIQKFEVGFLKKTSWLFLLLCILFVLSASARAGLLACFLTILFVILRNLNIFIIMDNYKKIIFSLLFFIPVLVFYFDDLINYIIKILELDSDTRGIDSGGTGRVELWKMGINHISSNSSINSILGEGLRASSADVIGFSTESSYITIIIEHGLILGSLLIISIYFFVLVSFFNLKRKNNIHLVFFVFLFYACIQSIFNRYLIAIGNPFSIFLIILLFYYSKRFIFLAKSS